MDQNTKSSIDQKLDFLNQENYWYDAGVDGYFYNERIGYGGPTPLQRRNVRKELTKLHETTDDETQKYINSKVHINPFDRLRYHHPNIAMVLSGATNIATITAIFYFVSAGGSKLYEVTAPIRERNLERQRQEYNLRIEKIEERDLEQECSREYYKHRADQFDDGVER